MKETEIKTTAPVGIPAEKIRPFEGHPYKVSDNEEMSELTESIRRNGILSPLLVRPLNDETYELISGHRRLHAAVKVGMTTVPAIVLEVGRDDAAVMVVDSNLHREHILPSEKAFAYKLKADALSHQGQRTFFTSGQPVPKSDENRTTAQIGEDTGESYKTVQRYIRLTHLIPELLDMMDEGRIALSPGVELSYLDEETQYALLEIMEREDCTPSYSQAWRLHNAFRDGTLTEETLDEIMREEKANQRETFRIPAGKLQSVLPKGLSGRRAEEYVLKACEFYKKYLQKKKEQCL